MNVESSSLSSQSKQQPKQQQQQKQQQEQQEEQKPASSSCLLPIDFQPTPYSVIIGRGNAFNNAQGNQNLLLIAKRFLPQYTNPNISKQEKTQIVTQIIDMIQQKVNSNNSNAAVAAATAAFIKLGTDGRWSTVNTHTAREKVGYVMRDLLCDKYKSSSKAKNAKRRIRRQEKKKQKQQKQQEVLLKLKQYQEETEAGEESGEATTRSSSTTTISTTTPATTTAGGGVNTASPADISVSQQQQQQQSQFRHQQKQWLHQHHHHHTLPHQMPFSSEGQRSATNSAVTSFGNVLGIPSSPPWSPSLTVVNPTATGNDSAAQISQHFNVGSHSSIPYVNQSLEQEQVGSCNTSNVATMATTLTSALADAGTHSGGVIPPPPPSSSTEPLRKFLEPSMMGWMQSSSSSSSTASTSQRNNFNSYLSLESNKQYNWESFFDVHVTPNNTNHAENHQRRRLSLSSSSLSTAKVGSRTASRNIMLCFEKSGFKQRFVAQDNDVLPTCSLNDGDVLLPLDTTATTTTTAISKTTTADEHNNEKNKEQQLMIDLPFGDSLNSIFDI